MTRPGPKRLKQSPRMLGVPTVTAFPLRQLAADTHLKKNDGTEAMPNATFEWNYVVSCEARNALQVVLSGGEILLDQHFGALTPAQRGVLIRMLENARQLHSLIATLRDTKEPSLFGR